MSCSPDAVTTPGSRRCAQLIYLPGASHNVHQDRPVAVLGAIAAFLDQGPFPVSPYQADTPPAGYEGP
jgi:alpha-beta hydrolase superfamily lysophospholipase